MEVSEGGSAQSRNKVIFVLGYDQNDNSMCTLQPRAAISHASPLLHKLATSAAKADVAAEEHPFWAASKPVSIASWMVCSRM